jgi:hypothetical protein
MERPEIGAMLQEQLRGVHEELGSLFRGIEANHDQHLARTEAALAEALRTDAGAAGI